MLKKLLLLCLFVSVVAGLGMVNYLSKSLQQPLQFQAEQVNYTVPAGASIKRVLADFERMGWINHARVHELWLRYQQKTNIQRGEYVFEQGLTSIKAIEKLISGEKLLRSIQLIEGKTVADYLKVIAESQHLSQTLTGLSQAEIMAKVSAELTHMEGWFFPDTYLFEKGTSDLDLLKMAHLQMQQVLAEEWQNKADDSMVKTPYEALILASIIEKETGAAFERPMISGVFTRRLRQGMRLQTDPTIIYGLGADFDGNLTRSHLRTDGPYNTYTRKGLTPTPIANPGREAIRAALNPADGESIFFVAKGDGTHHFSKTLAEHNAAVRQYQRFGRRSDYQSAPATEQGN